MAGVIDRLVFESQSARRRQAGEIAKKPSAPLERRADVNALRPGRLKSKAA
jgi:hypothetical protein